MFWLLIILGIIAIAYLQFHAGEDPPGIIQTPEGDYELSPDREAKLAQELEEIEHAEQYVLLATASRDYPCYSCPNGQKTIFLRVGEVWRYGTTRKGEAGRYPGQNYGAAFLTYVPQFLGTLGECLREEKIKIYHYPLLPEALARDTKLIRPPGNKNDN